MIEISQKLSFFSHTPGIMTLIPATPFAAEVFPALIRLWDLSGLEKKCVKEIALDVEGGVEEFTVMQDLERGVVSVWGKKHRLHILPTLEIVHTRNPGIFLNKPFERLSLGSHKKQDWEKTFSRLDFTDIFPLWHRLGSLLPSSQERPSQGMFSLLEECRQAVVKQPENCLKAFKALFLAGFEGMLVPHLFDNKHHGIIKGGGGEISPLHLLTEGASLIRSLFIEVKENQITFLPHLPPQFFAGRLCHCQTPFGVIHLEWSKKRVRRVYFESTFDGALHFRFPSSIHEFRLQKEKRWRSVSEPVEIKSDTLYLLDRFQK